jgi:hypothetical protein
MAPPTHGRLAPTVLADPAELPLPTPAGGDARATRGTHDARGAHDAPAATGRRTPPHEAALAALLAALLLGLAGDLLLRATPWGVNAPLATLALVVALAVVARRDGRTLTAGAALLAALAVAFAGALAWRDSAVLAALNLLALGTTLCALAAAVLHGDALPIDRAGPFAYLAGVARTAAGVLSGASGIAAGAVHGAGGVGAGAFGAAAAVGRGALLAAPVLLVFGVLLASADRTFARVIERLTAWELGPLAGHAVATLGLAWLAGGYLYAALLAPARADAAGSVARGAQALAARLRVGAREVCVALALVDALLLAFAALQLGWLFGGSRALALAGVTVAEYARRGFFELLAVAALALPLLLVATARVGGDGEAVGHAPAARRLRRHFRLAAGALVALVLVLLVSALDRMRLYRDVFGLTEARLYATAFLVWLGVVCAWAGATLLRGRPAHFALGTVASAWVAVLALDALDPDARIVRTNVARAEAGRAFDVGYVTRLSADAVPALVDAALPLVVRRGDQAERCALAHALRRARAQADAGHDWRTANVARARAARGVAPRAGTTAMITVAHGAGACRPAASSLGPTASP